jgi:tetratricopeptide (TPR) repeat protein
MITYLCERCELSSLFNYLAEYEEVVLEERVKYEEVKTIYQIIESVRKDHYLLYKYKLFFKLILAKGSDEQYGLKDQVEYLLMSDKLTDYILIWSCLGQKEIKQKLSEFIMKKYKVRSLEVPKLLKEFKNEIQKKIKITVDKNKSSTESIEEHEDGKTIENIQLTTVLPPSPNQPIKYKTSQAESDLLSLIKIEDEAFYSNADLVVSFIELNFLNMAEKIAISLDNSSNKKYLIAYIKLLKGHYSESIEECNECLSYYQLTAEQTVPFEYIKAEAFEQMGDRVSALRCYRNVIKYDPEFRQAQEKLNEQAK